VVGEIVVLSAALLVLMRALSLPMTLFSALRSLLVLPKTLFTLLARALAIFFSLFSLLEDLLPILKAAAALMVIAMIVVRLQTLVSRLRLDLGRGTRPLTFRPLARVMEEPTPATQEVPGALGARGS
jgi:hypothetical protein